MVREFCVSGNREGVKGSVHGAACALAVVMAAYNAAAWCTRRERHLGTNAVIYLLATAWEVKQTLHHFLKVQPDIASVPALAPALAAAPPPEEKTA